MVQGPKRAGRPGAALPGALTVLLCASTALLAGAGPASALTATSTATSRSGQDAPTSVTLVLSPTDRRALHALATGGKRPTTAAQRQSRAAAVRRLVPQPTDIAQVAHRVHLLGLEVTATSSWSVTATGRADAVRRAFGSAPAGGSLPGRPLGLGRLLSTVVSSGSGHDARHPLDLGRTVAGSSTSLTPRPTRATTPGAAVAPDDGWKGPDLRAAYGLTTDGTAPAGLGGQTVATVQFSGWRSADLSTWAAARHLPDPRRSGQYQEVVLPGASAAVPDGRGGDLEVALDQESLLGVAPHAAQRVYVAVNSDAGSLAALHRIVDDATDAAAGFHGLSALSTSWGICEPDEPRDVLLAEEDGLEAVVASGVTVVAASGDHGALDCSGPTGSDPAVDFPASSPVVVGVGGTDTDQSGTTVGWSGSGGGVSRVFARPAYQPGSVGAHRAVPDVSLVADPFDGFSVFSSALGGWAPVGGTSLSAPVFTGMLTAASSAAGVRWGVGDIHQALYDPPVPGAPAAVIDVVRGSNGAWSAGPGYDSVTGVGTPSWTGLGPRVLGGPVVRVAHPFSRTRSVPVQVSVPDGSTPLAWWSGTSVPTCSAGGGSGAAPTAIDAGGDGWHTLWVQALLPDGRCLRSRTPVLVDTHAPAATPLASLLPGPAGALRVAVRILDPAPTSGPSGSQVVVTDRATGSRVLDAWEPAGRAAVVASRPGATYDVSVSAMDRAGNWGPSSRTAWTAPIDDRAMGRSPHWTTSVDASALAGSVSTSSDPLATLTWRGAASRLSVLVRTSPAGGLLDVWVDGQRLGVVSTAGPVARQLLDVGRLDPRMVHTVLLRPLGEGRSGTAVTVDGIVAAP